MTGRNPIDLCRLAAERPQEEGWHEPYELRGSRTDLWGTGGAIPPVYPAVHEALVKECVKPELVGHISRDATAIEGRERPVKKPKKEKRAAAKRGRPRKGEIREAKEEKRLERQCGQPFQEALQELAVHCDVGTKKNSKGYKERPGLGTSFMRMSTTGAYRSEWS